jgi:hypothetical protein
MNFNTTVENGIYKIKTGNFLLCVEKECLPTIITTNWTVNESGIYKGDTPILTVLYPESHSFEIFFKDGNRFNLNPQNMEFVEKSKMKNSVDEPDFEFKKKIPGVYKTLGKTANHEKNNAYLLHNGDIKMHIGANVYTTIDADSLEMIRNFGGQQMCWYRLANGYVGSHYTSQHEKDAIIYLHQLLTNFYNMKGNKDNFSVDHIDRNKLNNKKENLRIITQSEQNQNCNIRIQEKEEKFMLIFDRKVEDKRYNMRMVMDKAKSAQDNLDGFIEKIKAKYPELQL